MIALTFDTDHMTETMMSRFLDILPSGLPFTFFCHRPFSSLKRGRDEIAMHPYLAIPERWLEVTNALRAEIESMADPLVGLRPHSLMSSQPYLVQLHEIGIRYISSITIHPDQDMPCFRYPWGPVEIPIRYMDNMDLWARDRTRQSETCFSRSSITKAIAAKNLFCFDFHPIHIFLNTSRLEDYEQWGRAGRPELSDPVERPDYGTRDFFLDLCREITRSGAPVVTCRQAAEALEAGHR